MLGGSGAGGAGALAQLAPLLGGLSRSGINAQTAMALVPVVLRFLEPHLGAGRFGQLLSSIPALQGLLGGGGGGGAGGGQGPGGGLGDVMKKLF